MKHRTIALLGLIALLLSAYNTGDAALTPEEKQAIAQIRAHNTAFKAIAREVTPSVVTINVTLSAEDVPAAATSPSPLNLKKGQIEGQTEDHSPCQTRKPRDRALS